MSALSAVLLKLVTAGLICGGLLSLGGTGPQREILRFGCACLMVVLLLTTLRQTQLPKGSLAIYEAQIQGRVSQAQADQRQALLEQTQQALEQEIARQAAELSLDCRVKVGCAADGEGRVTVTQVTVLYGGGPRERLQELRQTIAAQLALPADRVTVQEEETP